MLSGEMDIGYDMNVARRSHIRILADILFVQCSIVSELNGRMKDGTTNKNLLFSYSKRIE